MEPVLPPGYWSRPIDDADVPAIVDFMNAESIALTGNPEAIVSEYLVDLNEPGFDRVHHSRSVLDARGEVAAAAEIHFVPPFVRIFAWARVAPDHRGRGIGTALAQWLEAQARERLPEAPEGAEVGLEAWCYSGVTDARRLLEDHGYSQARVFHTMQIEMLEPPAVPVPPPGIAIASLAERPADLRAVHRATREAFSDHYGFVERDYDEAFVEWEHNFTGKVYDPSLKFLAWDGDQIAGVSLSMPPVPGEVEFAWVQQLAVRRPWRRLGLAQALLLHTFREYFVRGVDRVGLGVDADSLTGATRLYEKVGMRTTGVSIVYRKVLRPGVDLAVRSLDQ